MVQDPVGGRPNTGLQAVSRRSSNKGLSDKAQLELSATISNRRKMTSMNASSEA